MTRAQAQEELYRYPYHYLPRLVAGRFQFHQVLPWGHEYLSYTQHVAELVGKTGCTSVLDVGCGDGRLAALLKSTLPDAQIVGLDMSARAIALAKAMAPNARFVAGDITRPDLFQERFDCATCVDTLEHIDPDSLPEFVAAIGDQLKPSGTLIVTVPSTNIALNKKHYQHFDPELLEATLSPRFKVRDMEFLNASSPVLRLLRALLTNRVYTVTHPAPATAFYKYYIRNYLHSDWKRCSRLLAICDAK